MDGRIGRVLELLRDEAARIRRADLLRLVDGPLHAERTVGEDDFGAVGGEQPPAFDAHRLRHGEDEAIPFDRGGEGQPDAGIAAGGFDDEAAGLEDAAFFGIHDHGEADAVLDTAAGVGRFDFDENFRAAAVEPVDPNQRSMPDQFGGVRCNASHLHISSLSEMYGSIYRRRERIATVVSIF